MVTVNSSKKKGFPEISTAAFVLAMFTVALVFAASAQDTYPGRSGALDREPATFPAIPEAAAGGPATAQSILGPDSAPETDPEKQKLSAFFLIGIVINIVMIFVVGIWAYREWQRRS